MNSPKDSTTGAPSTSPTRFDHMSLNDMRNFFEGVQAAHHVVFTNECVSSHTTLPGSYAWFAAEAERLATLMKDIAVAAYYRQPADEDDNYDREQILVRAKPFISGPRVYTTETSVRRATA